MFGLGRIDYGVCAILLLFPDISAITGCHGYFFGIHNALVGEVVEFNIVGILHLFESILGGLGDRFEGDLGIWDR